MIRQYENGQTILHEITNINRAATYLGRNDFSLSGGSSSSNNQSVPQNGENVPVQEKSRLSSGSSISDATDSLRALSCSREIGNNHILTRDSENVNDYDSALVQPNNPEIRQTVCCVLVLPESNCDITRMFKVIIQYR